MSILGNDMANRPWMCNRLLRRHRLSMYNRLLWGHRVRLLRGHRLGVCNRLLRLLRGHRLNLDHFHARVHPTDRASDRNGAVSNTMGAWGPPEADRVQEEPFEAIPVKAGSTKS